MLQLAGNHNLHSMRKKKGSQAPSQAPWLGPSNLPFWICFNMCCKHGIPSGWRWHLMTITSQQPICNRVHHSRCWTTDCVQTSPATKELLTVICGQNYNNSNVQPTNVLEYNTTNQPPS
jgi:hypothetical protein